MWWKAGCTGRRTLAPWEQARGGHLRLPVVHLGHPPHASAPQPDILVAVAPAVHRALDQAALLPEVGIQLRQRPPDRVAFALVVEAVALILVLAAACTGVDAVVCFKLRAELLDVDGLDVAPYGVFHLDAVPRVLKGNPLHAVVILSDDKRGRGRNGTRSCT